MNLLDCLHVSQMDRLLHLKVVVFIHQEKANLLTVSAEKQRNCLKSITENWRQTGTANRNWRQGLSPAFPPVVGSSDFPPSEMSVQQDPKHMKIRNGFNVL